MLRCHRQVRREHVVNAAPTARPVFQGDDTSAPNDDAHEEWQAGRLGTRRPELEENDDGRFDLRFLAIAGAIVTVAFFTARSLW